MIVFECEVQTVTEQEQLSKYLMRKIAVAQLIELGLKEVKHLVSQETSSLNLLLISSSLLLLLLPYYLC